MDTGMKSLLFKATVWLSLLALALSLSGCAEIMHDTPISIDNLPAFSGQPYIELNGNVPLFTEEELSAIAFEDYAPLDILGRCGAAVASVGVELMPTEDRGAIGSVKPSGWQTSKYDFVDGKYLYNRCHLIGYQLSGENANEENLITGTRYMNTEGMLPFENEIADYVRRTEHHVMYRVTPIFRDTELVARGVTMEAVSVEDGGEGLCFYVYCYNVQPGVDIDYRTGQNHLSAEFEQGEQGEFVLNRNSRKIHRPTCNAVSNISEKNRQPYTGSLELLLAQGYERCGECF